MVTGGGGLPLPGFGLKGGFFGIKGQNIQNKEKLLIFFSGGLYCIFSCYFSA